jgi:hypothetical protein
MIFAMLNCLAITSVFAGSIYYKNNSDYDIRMWEMICGIEADGTQTCTDEYYAGYILAHQTLTTPHSQIHNNKKIRSAPKAGVHVTQATLNASPSYFDPKGLITHFPICNSIHENEVETMLTFDVDPETGAVTCKETAKN